jgi:hypothetical protein
MGENSALQELLDTRFDYALCNSVFDQMVPSNRYRERIVSLSDFVKAFVFRVPEFDPGSFYVEWTTKVFPHPPNNITEITKQREQLCVWKTPYSKHRRLKCRIK